MLEWNSREQLWVLFKMSLQTQRYDETIRYLADIATSFEEISRNELESIAAAYKLVFADRRIESQMLKEWSAKNPDRCKAEVTKYEVILEEELERLVGMARQSLSKFNEHFRVSKRSFVFYKLMGDVTRYLLEQNPVKNQALKKQVNLYYSKAYALAKQRGELFSVEGVGLMANFTSFQGLFLEQPGQAIQNINLVYMSVLHEQDKWPNEKKQAFERLLQVMLNNKRLLQLKIQKQLNQISDVM